MDNFLLAQHRDSIHDSISRHVPMAFLMQLHTEYWVSLY